MPWSSIMPTGGVDITEESLRPWFESGVSAVGMGSKLVSADILTDGAWDELENRSRDTVELIKSIRGR